MIIPIGYALCGACALHRGANVEAIYDRLKNIQQVAHSRYRSEAHFTLNVMTGLIACTHQE